MALKSRSASTLCRSRCSRPTRSRSRFTTSDCVCVRVRACVYVYVGVRVYDRCSRPTRSRSRVPIRPCVYTHMCVCVCVCVVCVCWVRGWYASMTGYVCIDRHVAPNPPTPPLPGSTHAPTHLSRVCLRGAALQPLHRRALRRLQRLLLLLCVCVCVCVCVAPR
jgi:hypothetical protein